MGMIPGSAFRCIVFMSKVGHWKKKNFHENLSTVAKKRSMKTIAAIAQSTIGGRFALCRLFESFDILALLAYGTA